MSAPFILSNFLKKVKSAIDKPPRAWYNKGTKKERSPLMNTFYLTIYHWNEIKNEVLHGEPEFFEDEGILCVKVEMHEEAFFQFARKNGWV
jgi:hypothetical protein